MVKTSKYKITCSIFVPWMIWDRETTCTHLANFRTSNYSRHQRGYNVYDYFWIVVYKTFQSQQINRRPDSTSSLQNLNLQEMICCNSKGDLWWPFEWSVKAQLLFYTIKAILNKLVGLITLHTIYFTGTIFKVWFMKMWWFSELSSKPPPKNFI